jgi:hypothetical protein
MSSKAALLKEIRGEREPDNPLACFALADMLAEEGALDLSFAYRWMGWKGKRPGYREGKRLRMRFVWYEENAFGEWPSDEWDRYRALPMARLHPLVFQAMGPGNRLFWIYATWDDAIASLSVSLALLRGLLEPGETTGKAK